MGTCHKPPLAFNCDLPILGYLLLMAGMYGVFGILFLWILKPTVWANPGIAAYVPPPATLLIPPPGKMDAPELAAIEASPMTVPARDNAAAPAQAKPEKHMVVRKRPKPIPQFEATYRNTWAWNNDHQQDYWRSSLNRQDDYKRARSFNGPRNSWSW
jgi:hypothetical protein